MIELKYTIPKINGKELTYEQAALLLGYEKEVESEPKKKTYRTKKEMMEIVDNSLTAQNDPEKKEITYTEFVPNPITPEQYVQAVFQKVVTEKLVEKLKELKAQEVATELLKKDK